MARAKKPQLITMPAEELDKLILDAFKRGQVDIIYRPKGEEPKELTTQEKYDRNEERAKQLTELLRLEDIKASKLKELDTINRAIEQLEFGNGIHYFATLALQN